MSDRAAVLDHFAATISAYRSAAHVESWTRVSTDVRQLGEHSVFCERALERARRRRASGARHLDELPLACHSGRVAPSLVHESLLSRAGWLDAVNLSASHLMFGVISSRLESS
jgi:hypothetical protein